MESHEREETNIQIGVYIPTQPIQTVNGKILKTTAGKLETEHSKENHETESSGRSRKGRVHSDNLGEDSEVQVTNISSRVPEVAEMSCNGGTEMGVKSVSCKNKRKRSKKGQKSSGLKRTKTGSDREDALDYLHRWNRDISSWSFRKKTQYWLLQNACDKSQVRERDSTHANLLSKIYESGHPEIMAPL